MRTLGVIPARFGAQRFPGKPLELIAGKPLVQRVWERAMQCSSIDAVVVATDDQRIADCIQSVGGEAVLTSPEHASGTDRLGEVASRLDYDYYINIQGDEPLLDIGAVDRLVQETAVNQPQMSTIVTPLDLDGPDLDNPNCVKVVCDSKGYALYFSRSRIPYPRNPAGVQYWKHIGIYMFQKQTLLDFCVWSQCNLEQVEGLEQLRALYHGVKILAVPADYFSIEVNAPEDVPRVEQRLREMGGA